MTQTVLVTGGTGYVAGWCIVELLRRGYAVRATVRSLAKGEGVRAAVATQVEPGDRLAFVEADLMADAGWDAAMAGCAYVLHVASPLGIASKNPDDIIRPAREGALRVLGAAVKAGVKRVVLTSSTAACASVLDAADSTNDETVWTDPTHKAMTPYRVSKVLSERAAWEFMAEHGGSTELTTVLPSAIFGPVLSADTLGSVMVVGRVLSGKMPGAPRVGFSVVDVRDLAVAHVLAMVAPQAAGERFIACGEFMWMAEIGKALRAGLGARGAKATVGVLPDLAVRAAALTDPNLRSLTVTLGRRHAFNSAKAQRVLDAAPGRGDHRGDGREPAGGGGGLGRSDIARAGNRRGA